MFIRKSVCKQVLIPRSSDFHALLWLKAICGPAMLVYSKASIPFRSIMAKSFFDEPFRLLPEPCSLGECLVNKNLTLQMKSSILKRIALLVVFLYWQLFSVKWQPSNIAETYSQELFFLSESSL
ncbi:MAG: hypothetical protein CSA81_13505 [Acidobacteria bacterium]|nr:MAG: hypothetical protein CSA81_13505 [Acidobacteriota bacterium]